MSEEMSRLSSTKLNQFVLPQLLHVYQNHFRPALIRIDREMRKRRECPQLLQSAVCLVIVTTTDIAY